MTYLDVDADHGGHRHVEVEERGGELEGEVVVEGAAAVGCVGGRPGGDGQEPEEGEGPGEADHGEGAAPRPLAQVPERRADRPEAVEREREQVEDGGRAGRVVGEQPELAQRPG